MAMLAHRQNTFRVPVGSSVVSTAPDPVHTLSTDLPSMSERRAHICPLPRVEFKENESLKFYTEIMMNQLEQNSFMTFKL